MSLAHTHLRLGHCQGVIVVLLVLLLGYYDSILPPIPDFLDTFSHAPILLDSISPDTWHV